MMGSLLTRALVLAFGYAYPAYECYKTVEKNKPEIEQLRFWCQYWILVAVLTVFERFGGDAFISWLPMYSEAKLAFYIYLWYPKTKGTTYVYDTFFRPYVAKHEGEIDRNLLELRARAGDAVVLYWHRAAMYGQTRFFETLQYVAAQSQSSRPHPVQKRPQPQQEVQKPPPMVPPRKTAAAQPQPSSQPTPHPPPSPAKKQVQEPPPEPATAPPVPSPPPLLSQTPSAPNSPTAAKTAGPSKPDEAEPMQVDQVTKPIKEDPNPPPKETIIEEAIRVTRGRMRKTRSASAAISTSPR